MPELALGSVPAGTHVLVMTHDHAEDFAVCDAALRCGHLASIGLIGSTAKWTRFRSGLRVEGHDEEVVARIQCPVGDPSLGDGAPPSIALGIAEALVRRFAADRARVGT